MSNTEKPSVQEEQKAWKSKGKKAMLVNIVFFLVLFIGIILVPLSGFAVAAVFIVLVFIASILYIYLF